MILKWGFCEIHIYMLGDWKTYYNFAPAKKEEGTMSLFLLDTNLLTSMIEKKTIIGLTEDFLRESDNYLIDVQVSTSNKIKVFIDNDENVSIKDCIALSRHIEHSLDRENDDFELEVSSPGIDQAFRNIRQYHKYLSKPIEILLKDGNKFSGTLYEISKEEITILPAPQGKTNKKITQTLQNDNIPKRVPFAEIKEARPVIIF